MSELLKLRDYQRACIDAFHTKWDAGGQRIATVLPTGAGKTVVFSHLIKEYLDRQPDRRVIVLAHTDELVNQAVKKLRQVAPGLKVGIVKAQRNEVRAKIVVASVQSLRSEKRRALLRNVGLIVVDECHHAVASTYMTVLKRFRAWEAGGALVAGFTATLARGDDRKLSEVWEDVCFRRDILFMIRRGYLLDVRGKRIEVPDFDLRQVKKSRGDYQADSLGTALVDSFAPEIVARDYVKHASDRAGILFAPTVDSAYAFADALNAEGVKSEVVHGALPREERRAVIDRLNNGTTQVLCNCMVLTEGFDSPRVSCVVIARPTKSAPLYQQMVGRALRPDPTIPREGQEALVLDVVGAGRLHDLRSLVDLSEREDRPDRELDEDLTLLELEEAWEEEQSEGIGDDGFQVEAYIGETVAVDFDPLRRESSEVWQATDGGTYFIGIPQVGYVFLIPTTQADADPGTYDVLWATLNMNQMIDGQRGGITEHVGVDLAMAMAWGEDVAEELQRKVVGPTGLNRKKSASWRRTDPSEAQLRHARGLGLEIPEGAKKGDVAALIDQRYASRRIDPIADWFTKQRSDA